ncbi:MAG: NADH-quinone oxidoreductase subunit C [Anaerolineae bacterium]|jgi:NADH-quinone oxidoreductase subunit C|nr:NADH-quinone oxidoreductase subunit C [Anaerolineae bacterium]MBT7072327.1 NADH-quinone oxidoreductase subunit C [Anaerolineae bacterium]MBT7326047.1 NADH-quinone oxidoreductase subunit C [Anaerolineae bacterium]
MDKQFQAIVQMLEKDFGAEVSEFCGEVQAVLPAENLVAASQKLRDKFEFALLSTITATDYGLEESPRFHVVYIFNSLSKNLQLMVRVPVDGENSTIPTLTVVYKNANWRERELWDMFGITAEGHPDLRRILMPDDWDGYPLRKDYPLGYEEPQFTFNFEEIDLSKPKGEF